MTRILWFKRDLRVTDHAALALAAEGPVLPLYIVEPGYWALPDTSARQWEFTRECVEDLRARLSELGASLIVRVGEACEILEALRHAHGVTELISHEETGNLWTYQRDQAVARWSRAVGIRWHQLPQSGVVRRLTGRDGWAAQRERYVRAPQILKPTRLVGVPSETQNLPTAAQLGMKPDPCPQRQKGGWDHAMSLLGGFLTERGQTYRGAMSSPLAGEWACSRLSPYLALGVLSGREAAHAAHARAAEVKGQRTGWAGSMRSFQSRLAWRDHFMQKLEDEPEIERRELHPAYREMRQGSDAARLQAWATGQTGIPFVDACMRFLDATGWLNFRMRAMVQAVACYHLWLDWRDAGRVLARRFVDYEPGIHWSQAQMQAGTTGMNTVRIYNPIKQGLDQDPDGIFTRRWVPELADVPLAVLQEPWKVGGAPGYPPPIVDVKAAAREAKERVFAVRRGEAFHSESARIVHKHASRKGDRGFQRDPVPQSAGSEQLGFDFD